MRSIDGEQAQRELDAMGPAGAGWDDLTLNEQIEQNPKRYFAAARVTVSKEAPRQIAEEAATKRELAARALGAAQSL